MPSNQERTMKRIVDQWFKIRIQENGILKDLFHQSKDKYHAEKWGINKYGKIYGVEKVQRDDFFRDVEYIELKPDNRGMQIARNVYEVDINLTEMLFGEPKINVKTREKNHRQIQESMY